MIDLHTHSFYSDGSDSPQEIVDNFSKLGITIGALADHDCIDGVQEALKAGVEKNVFVLPAVEMDTESPQEIHILGYGIDIENQALKQELARQRREREKRNEKILDALAKMDIYPVIVRDERSDLISRTHIAQGLVDGGYAVNLQDAFQRYLGPEGAVRIDRNRCTPAEVIELIHQAGGLAVLAHPGLLKQNQIETIKQIIDAKVDGMEAYYPRHTLAQIVEFCQIAKEHALLITAGSDYHGAFRKEAPLGIVSEIAQRDEQIQYTESVLRERYAR